MVKVSSFVEWETLDRPVKERGSEWFISVAIIAFAIAVASVILANYIFAILVIVGTASLLLHSIKIPKQITVRIFDKGVLLDRMLYPFDGLVGFYINEHENKLLLKTNKAFLPIIAIAIENMGAEEIRKVLSKNIIEEEIEESFWEKLMDHFGF